MVEQHRDGQHRRGGVGNRLARNIGRAAVHRLEHARRRPGRIDVAARRESDTTSDRRTQVGEDVAEQVVGHDDVEALRIGHEVDGRGIDVAVVDRNVGEVGRDCLDRAGPQIAGVHEHIVLVHQGELVPRARRRAGKRVAHHPLDAVGGVDALFGGDLVWRALAQESTSAGIGTLGAFADHQEVDVGRADPGQRARHTWEQLHRAQIHEVVELEPQPQQQAALKHTAGHPGIADRAEQDRVVAAQLVEHRIGQRFAGRVPAPGAEVVLGALDLHVVGRRHRVEDLQALVDHLGAYAIPGDHGKTHATAHGTSVLAVSFATGRSLTSWTT